MIGRIARCTGLIAVAMVWGDGVWAAEQTVEPAAALLARYEVLSQSPDQQPIGPGLYLESTEAQHALRGEVLGVVDYPLATLREVLATPQDWCDVLILHLNVKYCRPESSNGRPALSVAVGRKTYQSLESTYRLAFESDDTASNAQYLRIELTAPHGPMGTSHYRIVVEAVALSAERSLLHFEYSYEYGFWARLAASLYLGGTGSDKVGFTKQGQQGDTTERYVGGLRGVVERNVMRYFLALEACLETLPTPRPARFEQRIQHWFDATERYARQLHEVDRDSYLLMKRREYRRQSADNETVENP